MASIGLLGFIKGASKVGLDALERRDEAEQELKKQKLLEQLRMATNKELYAYKDELDSKHIDKDQTTADLSSGKKTYRDANGNIVRQDDLTDVERATMQGEIEKPDLYRQKSLADIAQSKASAASSYASANYSRKAAANIGKKDSPDGSETTDFTRRAMNYV